MNPSHKITLINENKISSKNSEIAEIFHEYFITTNLGIEENDSYICDTRDINDPILSAVKNYEKHPSIIKIAENIETNEVFKFSPVSCNDVEEVVKSLNISKAITSRNIPTKIFKQNFDKCASLVTGIYNKFTIVPNFPSNLKYADKTLHTKKEIPQIKIITDQ